MGDFMKKTMICIMALILALFCVGCKDIPQDDNVITDVGSFYASSEFAFSGAMNAWDMAIINNDLYVATGDFDKNLGPTPLYVFNTSTSKWETSDYYGEESFLRFLNLNNKNIVVAADPMGTNAAKIYELANGQLEVFAEIKNALHVFDAEHFNNAYYFGCGYEDNSYPVVKFVPDKNEYSNIPLYKNGINVIDALVETEGINYKRVTDLFLINDVLFCSFSCSYNNGKTTIEFFELVNDRFEFRQAFKASGMKMNKLVKNQMLFNADASLGDYSYLSLGNLYRTSDFEVFVQIDIPNDACVIDLFFDKDNETTQLYVLAVEQTEDAYKNTIYKLDQNKPIEVFSFEHECSALSFVKEYNIVYVSLGGEGTTSEHAGEILKINLDG